MAQQIGTYRGVPVFRVSGAEFAREANKSNCKGAFSKDGCLSVANDFDAELIGILHYPPSNSSYFPYIAVLRRRR